jgi:hypothetical protein
MSKEEYIKEIKQYLVSLEKKWSDDELNELESFDETQLMYEAHILKFESISTRQEYLETRNSLIEIGLIKDRYKFNETTFSETDEMISKVFSQIGNNLPKCNKCANISFALNEVKDNLLIILCLTCDNSIKLNIEVTQKNDENYSLDNLLTLYFNELQNVFEYYSFQEDLIDFFSNKFYKYNPNSKNILSGIRIQGNINSQILPESKNNDTKRNRKISQEVKDSVWNRDGGKCVECGSNENLEFDHIIPFSKGGANTYRNIQLLCESCNRSKSDKIG